MTIDFFNNNCTESARNDKYFGLCDDEDTSEKTPAYSDIDNLENWISTVKNDDEIEVIFTPIDNCLIIKKVGTKDDESTCDGMLTFENKIFLVELKNKTKEWISKGKALINLRILFF
jgi:hypothetical protein